MRGFHSQVITGSVELTFCHFTDCSHRELLEIYTSSQWLSVQRRDVLQFCPQIRHNFGVTYQPLMNKLAPAGHEESILETPRTTAGPNGISDLAVNGWKPRTLFQGLCARFKITGQQYKVLRILRGIDPDSIPS